MKRIYLDFAATAPTRNEVIEGMAPYFSGEFGNPSSIHSFGRAARRKVEESRNIIAETIGASPREIIFTSGGTESDNLAIKGVAFANREKGRHIITTQVEHPAVLESCAYLEKLGWEITFLPVDTNGRVNPDMVAEQVRKDTVLISVMHANNEIGTIQPIAQIARIARENAVCFHVDGVQSFGHIPTVMQELGVDLFSMSAHKLSGPKGVGALYRRTGTKILPLSNGGGQEFGLRSGTLNVPGIVGMGIAAKLAAREMDTVAMENLRNRFLDRLVNNIENISINGEMENRLPNNLSLAIPSAEGEAVLIQLDRKGISCSTGSACSSSSQQGSHVLKAIGLPYDIIKSTVRFTLGKNTTQEDLDHVVEKLAAIVEELRAMAPDYERD